VSQTIPEALAAPKNNYYATAPPTVTDDTSLGYYYGSRWVDRVGKKSYTLVDPAPGAALWEPAGGGGGTGSALIESILSRDTHVPAFSGLLYMSVGKIPTSAAPITISCNSTLEMGWVEVDAADPSQNFDLKVEKVGTGIIASISLPATTTKVYTSALAVNLNAGDELRVYMLRTSGAARSTFSNILASLSFRER